MYKKKNKNKKQKSFDCSNNTKAQRIYNIPPFSALKTRGVIMSTKVTYFSFGWWKNLSLGKYACILWTLIPPVTWLSENTTEYSSWKEINIKNINGRRKDMWHDIKKKKKKVCLLGFRDIMHPTSVLPSWPKYSWEAGWVTRVRKYGIWKLQMVAFKFVSDFLPSRKMCFAFFNHLGTSKDTIF